MTVVLHQEGLRHLLRDPIGPVGLYIDAKARAVNAQAQINVSGGGPGPNVRQTLLYSTLRYPGLMQDTDGLVAYVMTDAVNPRDQFPYPLAQELGVGGGGAFPAPRRQPTQNYQYPFLLPALRSAFPEAV